MQQKNKAKKADNERALFPQTYRINRSLDFQKILSRGKKIRSRYFNFYVLPNNLSHSRIAFVIAKKNLRSAVKRNKVKRSIRESFRHNKQVLEGFDIILIAQSPIINCDILELRVFLDQQWGVLTQL